MQAGRATPAGIAMTSRQEPKRSSVFGWKTFMNKQEIQFHHIS